MAAARRIGIVEEDTINADYSLEGMTAIYLSDFLLNWEFTRLKYRSFVKTPAHTIGRTRDVYTF